MENPGNNVDIKQLMNEGRYDDLRFILKTFLPSDIVQLIEDSSQEDRLKIFNVLDPKTAVATFEFLPFEAQKDILQGLPSDIVALILNEMSPDDRTAFLEELPGTVVKELLKLLSPQERALTLKLLGYPEDSVGRLMTTDYIAVKMDWTVRQVLDYIREHGRDSETINIIYVIDDSHRLLGELHIRELLLVSPDKKISDIVENKFLALDVYDVRESAINEFRKSGRIALPVIDRQGVLLGIVTLDDILELASEEFTEDIQKVGGVSVLEEPYLKTPFMQLMKKRAGWLVILFIGEMFTASAMGFFQDEIAKAVVLSLFIPLIISSGGNSGSQASTLIIRSLALGEIKLADWWKIVVRELGSGLFLGSILGAIGFFRILTWTFFSNIYGPHWLLLAIVVFTSLIGVVLWGTLVGSMLPLLLKRLGFDPAVSSAPFVATLVDVTGIIIYFSIALIFLYGTLL